MVVVLEGRLQEAVFFACAETCGTSSRSIVGMW